MRWPWQQDFAADRRRRVQDDLSRTLAQVTEKLNQTVTALERTADRTIGSGNDE